MMIILLSVFVYAIFSVIYCLFPYYMKSLSIKIDIFHNNSRNIF